MEARGRVVISKRCSDPAFPTQVQREGPPLNYDDDDLHKWIDGPGPSEPWRPSWLPIFAWAVAFALCSGFWYALWAWLS